MDNAKKGTVYFVSGRIRNEESSEEHLVEASSVDEAKAVFEEKLRSDMSTYMKRDYVDTLSIYISRVVTLDSLLERRLISDSCKPKS